MLTFLIFGCVIKFSSNLFNICWFKCQQPEAEIETFSIFFSLPSPLCISSSPLSSIFLQLRRFKNIIFKERSLPNAGQKENSNFRCSNKPSSFIPSQISSNQKSLIFSHLGNSRLRLLSSFNFFKQSFRKIVSRNLPPREDS